MQNSIWKLVVLAGVVGIGFLAVLQAQHSLQNPAKPAGSGENAATGESPETELGASGDPELAAASFNTEGAATPFPAESLELAEYSDNHADGTDNSSDPPFVIEQADATNSTGPYASGDPDGLPREASHTDAPRSDPGLDFRDAPPKFADADPPPDGDGQLSDNMTAGDPFAGSDPFASPPAGSEQDDNETATPVAADDDAEPANSEPDPYVRMSPQPEPDPLDAVETGPAGPSSDEAERPIEPAGFEDQHASDDEDDLFSPAPVPSDNNAEQPDFGDEADELDGSTGENPSLPPAFDEPPDSDLNDPRPEPEGSGPVVIGPAGDSESSGDETSERGDSFPPLGPFDPSAPEPAAAGSDGPDAPAPADSGFEPDPFDDDPFGEQGMTPEASDLQPADDDVPSVGEFDPNPASDDGPPAESNGQGEPASADPTARPQPFPSSDPFPVENGDEDTGSSTRGTNEPATPADPATLGDRDATADEPTGDGDESAPNPLQPAPDATELMPQQPEGLLGDGTIDHDVPQGPQYPQLNVEKIAPPNAVIGRPLVYSIVVRNVGRVPARQVVVEDRIPKGTQLKGTNPQAELTDKRLIWKLGTLQPKEQRKISIRVVPFTAGSVGSVATVNFVSEVASRTLITAPKLEVDVDGPGEVQVGEKLQLKFKITNRGTGAAHGVVIRDLLPDGFKHPGGRDLEYEIGKLAAGETRQIKLHLTAAQAGESVNHAIVTADGGITTEAKTPLEVYATRLELSRSGPKRRYVGRAAVYTNVLENESNRTVHAVTVIEKIPSGMEFVEATSGGQFNEASGTVAWRVEQLEPQGKRVMRVKLVAKEAGVFTSVVKAIAARGEEVMIDSQTEVAGFAAIGVEIPEVAGPVDVGETVTFRVAALNRGTTPAKNVAMQIDVPDELDVVSARGPSKHEVNGRTIQFMPVAAIDGKTRAMFEITLRARQQGDARIRVQVQADHLSQPLSREEAVLILGDAPPTAAR